jgi:hypothetical protein
MAEETTAYKHAAWKTEMTVMRAAYTEQVGPAMLAMLTGLHRLDAGRTQISLFSEGITRVNDLAAEAEGILATSGADGDRVAEKQAAAGGRTEVYGQQEAHQN